MSVRSSAEALAALAGGANLIDIKEPVHGPLGRADASVWEAVRAVVPVHVPLSVALGELTEACSLPETLPAGIGYAKLGLAGAGSGWIHQWSQVRARFPSVVWVAVSYSDWELAKAPHPDHVLEAAIDADTCGVILVDTYIKSNASSLDSSCLPWVERARQAGLKIVLAGGLDLSAIRRLAPLRPDWFAVRGAACVKGDRTDRIDTQLVADLAACVVT